MFLADLPPQPVIPSTVYVIYENQQTLVEKTLHKMGVCSYQYMENSGFTIISPDGAAEIYISEYFGIM